MTDQEKAGYEACVSRMLNAARDWLLAHPCVHLAFADIEAEAARRQGLPKGTPIALIADLQTVIPLWACNDETRALLQAMEDASEHQATYLQAQAILEQLLRRAVSHDFDLGLHNCPWCGRENDCGTMFGGADQLPDWPAIGVCIECTGLFWFEPGSIRQVSFEEQAAFDEATRHNIDRLRDALERVKASVGVQS